MSPLYDEGSWLSSLQQVQSNLCCGGEGFLTAHGVLLEEDISQNCESGIVWLCAAVTGNRR